MLLRSREKFVEMFFISEMPRFSSVRSLFIELAFISLDEDEVRILCEDLATLLLVLLLVLVLVLLLLWCWLWFVVSICRVKSHFRSI